MLLTQSVYQAALPQTLEVPPFSPGCDVDLEKKKRKKKDYSDVLWLKLNQVRTGHLIRKKENLTHRGPMSEALPLPGVGSRGRVGLRKTAPFRKMPPPEYLLHHIEAQ